MPRKPNPEWIDDEAPEAGAEWFAKALAAKDVLPGLLGEARPDEGRREAGADETERGAPAKT